MGLNDHHPGVRAGSVLLVVCVLGLLAVPSWGQVDPPPEPPQRVPLVGEATNLVWEELAPVLENETGEDLTQEEIDMDLWVDIRNADFDLVGILFGGGKVDVDVKADLRLEFRAISVKRIDDALRNATGDAQVSLNSTFGVDSSRMVLTAEEVRLLGGGVVLQAFQALQERAAARALEELLPGVTVLQADFSWENTLPADWLREGSMPRLREPPLVLEAGVTLRFLERYSLVEILELAGEEDPDRDERNELKRQIEENQTLPPEQRSAFMFLGYGQLLDLELPHGWRLNLTISVPQGFTIEEATSELVVDEERRSANYYLDGSARHEPFSAAGVVVVSNRFLVTATIGAVALVVGLVLRLVTEGGAAGVQAGVRTMKKRTSGSKKD